MTMPMPGAQPIAETRTYYVLYEDGALGRIETSEEAPTLTRPGQLVSEEDYQQHLAQMTAARETYLAALVAAETARQREDYQALRVLLVPEATARRLTGYQGEE